MTINTEVFQNQVVAQALLTTAMTNSQMTAVVNTLANFSNLSAGQQFRVSIQDTPNSPIELAIVGSYGSGNTLNFIARGIEGTTAIAHNANAEVAQVITAQHMNSIYPSGRTVNQNGNITIGTFDKITEIAQETPAAINITLPLNPILWLPYTVKDTGNNFEENTATILPPFGTIDDEESFLMTSEKQSQAFYCNGPNWGVSQ